MSTCIYIYIYMLEVEATTVELNKRLFTMRAKLQHN